MGPSFSLVVSRGDPLRIALKRGPFLLALGKRFPGQEVSELVIRFADHRRPEASLSDAVLLPYPQRVGFEPLQQRRQSIGQAAINAKLIDHSKTPLCRWPGSRALRDGVKRPRAHHRMVRGPSTIRRKRRSATLNFTSELQRRLAQTRGGGAARPLRWLRRSGQQRTKRPPKAVVFDAANDRIPLRASRPSEALPRPEDLPPSASRSSEASGRSPSG